MNLADNIESVIGRMQVTPTAEADRRILDDAFAAMEESVRSEWVAGRPHLWRVAAKSLVVRLAAAAVILLAALLSVQLYMLVGQKAIRHEVATQLQMERDRITVMLAAGDVNGLVGMLSEGKFEGRVFAAMCLGQIGDTRALAAMESLYLSAEQELPAGYSTNPFKEPLERIRARIAAKRNVNEPEGNVDEITGIDVNEVTEMDTNEITGGDANMAVAANVPPDREGVINFKTIKRQTSEPVAGVEFSVQIQRPGPDDKFRLLTNEQGYAVLNVSDMNTKYINIEISKEKFIPLQMSFRREGDVLKIPRSCTLLLDRGTSIGGFVRNEQGKPVPSAKVYVYVPEQDATGPQIRTRDLEAVADANGFWRLDTVPGDFDEILLRLAHPDYVSDEMYGRTTTPPIERLRNMTAVLVMQRGLAVAGRVVDIDGKGIVKAKVMQGDSRDVNYPTTQTDAQGRFEFPHVRGPGIILTVQREGYAPELKEISVYEGMAPVEFRLGQPRTIRGKVIDTHDNPLPGVGVSAASWRNHRSIEWQSQTNENGYFEWKAAPTDEVQFDFYKQGYMSVRKMQMSPGIDEYVVMMYPPLKVGGTVVDADSNGPIRNFRLFAGIKSETGDSAYWGRSGDSVSWSRSDAKAFSNGRYEHTFDYPYDGHLLRVESQGYLPAVSRIFRNDEGNVLFDFRLRKGQGISGVVYLPDGGTAAGAEVMVCTRSQGANIQNGWQMRANQSLSAVTDIDGRFSLPPQTEPYGLLILHDKGFARVTQKQFSQSPEITVSPWGRVEGLLQIGTKPGGNEGIALLYYQETYDPNAPKIFLNYQTLTDANGWFTFDRAVPGEAMVARQVRLTENSITYSHATPVTIVPGKTGIVTIGGTGRPVVGRIIAPTDYQEPVNFSSGHSSLVNYASIRPQPPFPANYRLLPMQEQFRWYLNWQKTDQGRAYIEQNLIIEYPDNIVDMTDEQVQGWLKQWQKSEKGRAYTKQIQELQKNTRSYAVRIDPNGALRADDVPAGKYRLNIYITDSPTGYPARLTQPIGTLQHDFEVPDTNEALMDKPLDLGTLELKMLKQLKPGDSAPAFEAQTLDGRHE